MPTDAEIDIALDAVIRAARHHRAVLKSQGATDEEIWVAYITLNNASVHYDDLVNQTYDEVTPWDCEYIDPDEAVQTGSPALGRSGVASHTVMAPLLTDDDVAVAPNQSASARRAGLLPRSQPAHREDGDLLLSVRQRRDYVIVDADAVLEAARAAKLRADEAVEESSDIRGLGEAIYALIEAGDGTLAALDDVAEIEPANGVVLINQTHTPVPLAELDDDPERAFQLSSADRLLYRLDEVMADDAEAR
ncbi:MAG TPA: hypothetical protein VHU91_02110 [Mycobacteriales bacterium]|jgi:hypothetical protein|nr:hypothetical protein [Mycobacteriales bacterium]